ncbi:methyltransferase-like protein 24 [Amphibalanus amphitrite]|uniref:methyltransferase-like protein 24 n=1 Tax=Amphibalanus amphitrite TaxID=1232801 RepID=UPI001C903B5F|nr:methyltransferase-like protein 24 [Amphibalanus amphitrite]
MFTYDRMVARFKVGCLLLVLLWSLWSCTWLMRQSICPRLESPPPQLTVTTEKHLLPPPSDDPAVMAAALFSFIELPQYWCRRLTMFGGQTFSEDTAGSIDGNKFICLDEPPALPCLVYSFGSRDEWSFERDVKRQLGCEVHTFDPSLSDSRTPKETHGAVFHSIGLGGSTRVNARGWKLATLRDLRAQLGHLTSLIAYLKVDIEGGEWEWLETEAEELQDVLQIGMEVHLPMPMTPIVLKRVYGVFRRLQKAGFRTVFSEVNRVWGRNLKVDGMEGNVGRYYEIVWVRVT